MLPTDDLSVRCLEYVLAIVQRNVLVRAKEQCIHQSLPLTSCSTSAKQECESVYAAELVGLPELHYIFMCCVIGEGGRRA